MTFSEAVSHVNQGKKLSRLEWNDAGSYVLLSALPNLPDQYLCIHNSNSQQKPGTHVFTIRDVDLIAEDWFIIGDSAVIN